MRLSDIKGDRAIEVLADLIGPITTLASDKEIKSLFNVKSVKKDKTGNVDKELIAKKLKSNLQFKLPALLKQHKEELFTVLSTLNGLTYEEYANSVSLPKLVTDVFDCITDPELQSLFTSAGQVTEKE